MTGITAQEIWGPAKPEDRRAWKEHLDKMKETTEFPLINGVTVSQP